MANRRLVCEWERTGTGRGDWAGRMDQGMVWVGVWAGPAGRTWGLAG